MIAKVLEVIILRRMTPVLAESGFPDSSQTAYQPGISCIDAVFVTQEALLKHMRDGGKSYLCLYDVEKAFDFLEFPVLMANLFNTGVNGKCWRLIRSWYDHPSSRFKHAGMLSESFVVERGVKQGSVLSPTPFLVVMDLLLKEMSQEKVGLSVNGLHVGSGGHTDVIRNAAASKASLDTQALSVVKFTQKTGLKLNTSKCEVVKMAAWTEWIIW